MPLILKFRFIKENDLNILKRNVFPSNKNFHLLNIKDFIIVEKIFW